MRKHVLVLTTTAAILACATVTVSAQTPSAQSGTHQSPVTQPILGGPTMQHQDNVLPFEDEDDQNEIYLYPHLVAPVKENELHQGRKRVDIAYSNAAKSGFFYEMLVANQTRALRILVECKNYSRELGNPEIDQLAGRFGPTRGRFGILCCREIFDGDALSESCRDTALDDRGFIVVLDDRHIEAMLDNLARGACTANDQLLRQLFDNLTN